MKRVLFTFLLSLGFIFCYSQAYINPLACDTTVARRDYTPAPCSFMNQGEPFVIYVIQVAAYQATVAGDIGTFVIQFQDVNRYYLAAFFTSKQEADKYLLDNNTKSFYCGAMAVPFPFSNMWGFK